MQIYQERCRSNGEGKAEYEKRRREWNPYVNEEEEGWEKGEKPPGCLSVLNTEMEEYAVPLLMPEEEPEKMWEEEEEQMREAENRKMPEEEPEEMWEEENREMPPQRFWQCHPYPQIIEDERRREQELRRMQRMYPQKLQKLLQRIEEICDKMEYEGSPMFDQYPDIGRIRKLLEEMEIPTEETIPLWEAAWVVLLYEICHRRYRHEKLRPHQM